MFVGISRAISLQNKQSSMATPILWSIIADYFTPALWGLCCEKGKSKKFAKAQVPTCADGAGGVRVATYAGGWRDWRVDERLGTIRLVCG